MPKATGSIKFLEDIAIADTAFLVQGKNPAKLFENASTALVKTMADISRIGQTVSRKITLESEELDILLFDYLNELLLLKDSENLLFSRFILDIKKHTNSWKLTAELIGEKADPEKHKITIDIKAITMHMFKLKKTQEGYEARVVVDI
ncbi:MAG: archease [Patescibacteria group bacterium]|nr:archease [Patescibacteria group bacterium]